jgi:thiol-disulfide isomerase/thioredoxin
MLAVLGGLLSTGCSSPGAPNASYVFKPDTSPVKVDTPALRAEKAAAGIPDCPKGGARTPTGSSKTLPDVTLPCLGGGRNVDLARLTGKPTVVNFWSQSCGPCRAESPILQRIHHAARGRLRVVGIDWEDSQPGMAIAFAKELGLTYPQIADPDAATRKPLGISGLPLSLYLDSSGRIVHANYGAVSSAGELTALVSRYLGVDVHLGGGQ